MCSLLCFCIITPLFLRFLLVAYGYIIPQACPKIVAIIVKFLGKSSVLDLELGTQVKKEVTTMFCDIRNSTQVSTSLSLEDNFNYINTAITPSPIYLSINPLYFLIIGATMFKYEFI